MLLSRTEIKLCICLHTNDGKNVFVELESEDIKKAAMVKANVSEDQLHPVGLMHFEVIS